MKTIVFIGANQSGSSYEAIRAAEELHYYTVLLTDRKSFLEKRAHFPHAHLMKLCRLDQINDIREVITEIAQDRFTVSAIVSFIDPHCHTAAILSREFGCQPFSERAIRLMLDKAKSRRALRGTPHSPPYHVICGTAKTAETKLELPVVLKAPRSSASKDVHIAQTSGAFQSAFSDLRKRYPGGSVLVEQYMPGSQYLVETLTIDGETHIVAVIQQEILFFGRFIVTGYQIITDTDGAFFRGLEQAARVIVQAHGMRDGPCHLELRHFADEWRLIEANPRISGGAMNVLIQTAYGINLAKETLKAATGRVPEFVRKHQKEAFLQYVLVPEAGRLVKVTGKSQAQNSPGVAQVYVKPKKGSLLTPPASMGQRYAYAIGTGTTAEEARANAKAGASKIKFHLRTSNTLSVAYPMRINELDGGDAHVRIDYFANNIVYEP